MCDEFKWRPGFILQGEYPTARRYTNNHTPQAWICVEVIDGKPKFKAIDPRTFYDTNGTNPKPDDESK